MNRTEKLNAQAYLQSHFREDQRGHGPYMSEAEAKGCVWLRNHSILNEMVHHNLSPQIWWNDSTPRTSTNY
jgi:hypothetical protein